MKKTKSLLKILSLKSFFRMNNKKAQILLEFLWMVLFIVGFLSSIYYFYAKAENKINKYRFGKNNETEIQHPLVD